MSGKILCAAAVIALAATVPASAQPAPATDKRKVLEAYELAMKCFTADGYARQNREKANDQQGAQYYDAKAKVAFDASVRLSKQLGYTSARYDIDFQAISNRELARLMQEDGYFQEIAAQCKAYGLM